MTNNNFIVMINFESKICTVEEPFGGCISYFNAFYLNVWKCLNSFKMKEGLYSNRQNN